MPQYQHVRYADTRVKGNNSVKSRLTEQGLGVMTDAKGVCAMCRCQAIGNSSTFPEVYVFNREDVEGFAQCVGAL